MIKRIDNLLEILSKWGIVVSIALMLGLTLTTIILRWFEVSLLWVDPMVRHLVFLAAFLGGSLATSSRNHIKIDVIARFLEKRKDTAALWLDRIITLITLVATLTLTYSSFKLSVIEFEFGHTVFFNIHSGYLISIIPFGMVLISLRLLLRFLLTFSRGS